MNSIADASIQGGVRGIFAVCLSLLCISGCEQGASSNMIPMENIPVDRTVLEPWFANLLEKDAEGIALSIKERLSARSSKELAPLIDHVGEFVPRRLCYSGGAGFVVCIQPASHGKSVLESTDFLIIAQPMLDSVIRVRGDYFDEPLRPLMYEFFSKFAGCGEGIEPEHSGQFALDAEKAKDIAFDEPEKLGEWKDAVLLYRAANGDSVFINKQSATAWHVHETNETVRLLDSFPQFIRHYVELRKKSNSIDSWTSRELLGIKQ